MHTVHYTLVRTQGILSRAVCWDVLEEQLFRGKVGGDEKWRKIFQTILTLDRENDRDEQLHTPNYVTTQKSLLGDVLSSASFHTDSQELCKDKYLSEAASSDSLSNAWPVHRNKTSGSSGSRLYWETVEMMRCVLDVGTHLSRFPSPLSPQNAIFIAAKDDLYVPRKHMTDVRSVWPGEFSIQLCVCVCEEERMNMNYYSVSFNRL